MADSKQMNGMVHSPAEVLKDLLQNKQSSSQNVPAQSQHWQLSKWKAAQKDPVLKKAGQMRFS